MASHILKTVENLSPSAHLKGWNSCLAEIRCPQIQSNAVYKGLRSNLFPSQIKQSCRMLSPRCGPGNEEDVGIEREKVKSKGRKPMRGSFFLNNIFLIKQTLPHMSALPQPLKVLQGYASPPFLLQIYFVDHFGLNIWKYVKLEEFTKGRECLAGF